MLIATLDKTWQMFNQIYRLRNVKCMFADSLAKLTKCGFSNKTSLLGGT